MSVELLGEFGDEVRREASEGSAIPRALLFTPAFVRGHTGFDSLEEFLAASGTRNPRGAARDRHVRSATIFRSFAEFEDAARRAYVARRIFEWVM